VVATYKKQGNRDGKSHPRGPVAKERDRRQGEQDEQGEEQHGLTFRTLKLTMTTSIYRIM
jgi:hypothetical protein